MPNTMLPSHSTASSGEPGLAQGPALRGASSATTSAKRNAGIIGPALHQAEFAGRIAEYSKIHAPTMVASATSKDQQCGALRREAAQHDVTVPAIPEYLTMR